MIGQSTEIGKARRPGLGNKLHLRGLWDTLKEKSGKNLDTLPEGQTRGLSWTLTLGSSWKLWMWMSLPRERIEWNGRWLRTEPQDKSIFIMKKQLGQYMNSLSTSGIQKSQFLFSALPLRYLITSKKTTSPSLNQHCICWRGLGHFLWGNTFTF